MTINTLEYMHELLKREETNTNEVYRAARQLQYEYEESETASKSLIESQKKAADEFRDEHFKAQDALADFENQEW